MPELVPVKRTKAPSRKDTPEQPMQLDPLWGPLGGELDELWERMVHRVLAAPGLSSRSHSWTPPVAVEETADAWIFEIELPGARREDLHVEVADTQLIVSGEVKERERSGVIRRRSTRRVGSFQYGATLPPGIDAGQVEARFDNGLLTVRVPRPAQAARRRINID